MAGRQVSHGRGGAGKLVVLFSFSFALALALFEKRSLTTLFRAGNIYTRESQTTPKDLVTPTIKQDVFTTGRGGSGNMMVNDRERPELARGSQDVEEPPMRSEEHIQFAGRGMGHHGRQTEETQ
jgi:hypothetical protein